MNKSRKDPNQITQYEHDDATWAKRVTIVNGEMAINVSADDGDSVQAQSRCEAFEVSNGTIMDISKYSRIKMYIRKDVSSGQGPTTLSISPHSSQDWFLDPTITLSAPAGVGDSTASQEVSVMGMRAKIECDPGLTVVIICKGL